MLSVDAFAGLSHRKAATSLKMVSIDYGFD